MVEYASEFYASGTVLIDARTNVIFHQLHGFVGYERIDADHRIIPNSRAFRTIRRNSSNPPNGRGAWKRRTRPAKYSCPVAYCGDAFTTKERLKSMCVCALRSLSADAG